MPAASVYLDHNATSPLRPEAFDAMVAALATGGNPSAVHSVGRKARGLVDKARRQVAARVGALPTEVIFTSGGTEANNMALAGAGRRRVLISSIEHESVQRAVPEADIVPVDGEGVLDLAALERKLAASGEPALVSVMFANNETGVLQPMADVVRIARKAGALVHCDAVQAAGKVPVDLHGIGIDYLSLAAHKLGGPTGVGALIVRADAPFVPNRFGGGQETNRRAGTENLSGIVGFGAAAEAARMVSTRRCAIGAKRHCWPSRPTRGCSARAPSGCPTRPTSPCRACRPRPRSWRSILPVSASAQARPARRARCTVRRCWRPWA